MPSEPSSRHTQWWDRRNSQLGQHNGPSERTGKVRTCKGPSRVRNHCSPGRNRQQQQERKKYKHTTVFMRKALVLPRSVDDCRRLRMGRKVARELEKREPHTRQPDPTHNTLQGPPPSSCRRSERSGQGISWNARQSRPTQHKSVF